jgi:hypothetical protein
VRPWLLVLAIALPLATARAETPVEKQARAHFEAGRALYRVDAYADAIREFAVGYDLTRKPEFLINIGLCQHKLGLLVEARDEYQRFLREVPVDHPRRAEVEVVLRELEVELAAQKAGEPKPAPVAAAQPVAPVAAPATTVVITPVRRPFIRRHWWIVPVVTVAAAGIAVGLGLGLTQNPCSGPDVGVCVHLKSP